jgi:hypothetical protein
VPGILLDLAIEHHAGIVQLVTVRVNGSAFALIRAEYEALVRAVWFQICATADELIQFVDNDSLKRAVREMVAEIQERDEFVGGVLANWQRNAWNPLNGYTHGGMHQVARRIKGATIEPSYEPEEVIEVLKSSGQFALMALLQIARLAGDKNVEHEIFERLKGAS